MITKLNLFFFSFLLLSFLNVDMSAARGLKANKENPFTPKAYLIRYWNQQTNQNSPKSPFLIFKASPLNAVETASYEKLAAQNTLSSVLPTFCSSAKLFCFPDLSPSLEKHDGEASFHVYNTAKNFTNYGTGALGTANSFKNYSDDGESDPVDSFRRYSRDAVGQDDKFNSYATSSNIADQSFNTYGTKTTGGTGEFKNYAAEVNVPDLRFTSYSDATNGREQSFKAYSLNTNSGNQSFTSYGKNGNAADNEFVGYSTNSNVIESDFKRYGETGNGANDTFVSYGNNGNVPENKFQSYGDGGNGAVDNFISYNKESNVGDNTFKSYAKNSNGAEVNFKNYEEDFNPVSHSFNGYGEKGAKAQQIGFKKYGPNRDFKVYAKDGVTFSSYSKKTTSETETESEKKESGKSVNKWVEPGKFFRESMLKEGSVMPMPDIKDKMPERSFLPRTIVSKLPFSSSKMSAMKRIFHAIDNSTMERIMKDALKDCERTPSPGETKRCVASAEDMIDFATSVLGRDVALRTTESVKGSKQDILMGSVKGINGGKVTKSVSCHQSLFPYLLYYCHSVPKVRVYEADILDSKTKAKINHGVAICHLDTSSWSPTHGAFLALGSSPGKIEVCHWIFENDLTWTIADH
ncbi:hypothetical protein Ddye_031272 [Dipteronia dyeriana]|uniref:BURP domain-containing protein n=1 Tax=Dipteronia dyeriana TaxID=168575 RepID=A0AAD9WNJ5_9ROSI|nr:hypothetical protein Ddye_031272 [Dipteronia dyeriana]